MITFRAPNDIDELLTGAEEATGSSRTDLIIEALRLNLSAVVQQISSKRSAKAAEFLRARAPVTTPVPIRHQPSGSSPRKVGPGRGTQKLR